MSLPELIGIIVILTTISAWWLTGRVRRYALNSLIDIPNSRSSHVVPTPRGGGLAIVVASILGVAVWHGIVGVGDGLQLALVGALPVAAIGFWDDHGHVSARLRILCHVLAAVWSTYWLGGMVAIPVGGVDLHLGWLGTVISVLWLVWSLNLFNFMDGIDGIAGSEALFITMAAGTLTWLNYPMIALAPLFLLFAGACLGFLLWNAPPARIFMGDVGSGFVGFVVAVFSLVSANRGGVSLIVWLILAGVFVVDATWTLARRMLSGQRWFEAHRSHAYQHATVLLGGHGPVTLGVSAVNTLWLLPLAVVAIRWPEYEVLILLLAYLPLAILARRLGAGTEGWIKGAGPNPT